MSESMQSGKHDIIDLDEREAREILELRLDVLRALPVRQQNAAILEELVTLTFTLQNAILKMQSKTTADIRAEAQRARAENARIRRRVTFTILASVVISLFTAIIGDNAAINHCFLRSSNLNHSSICNVMFPGYNDQVDEQKKLLLQFNSLVSEIPRNKADIKRIDDELAKIRAEIGASRRRAGR